MNNTLNYTLPGVLTLRGVRVRKERVGHRMRFMATRGGVTLVTTCPVNVAWKVINLLVDEIDNLPSDLIFLRKQAD